jgi:hypothetical protein
MRKTILISVIVVVVAASAGAAYWKITDVKSRAVPPVALQHVKNSSLRLANSLSFELTRSNVTYRELYQTLEKNVTEIDSHIIDIQSIETSRNRENVEPLIAYLRVGQDVLRAQEQYYQRQVAQNVTSSSFAEAQQRLHEASPFGHDYARTSAVRAAQEVTKANLELDAALGTFRSALLRLDKVRRDLERKPNGDVLCDPDLAGRVIEALSAHGA